jgi:hypothetical protein
MDGMLEDKYNGWIIGGHMYWMNYWTINIMDGST